MRKTIASILFLAAAITVVCVAKTDLHASCHDMPELQACTQDPTLNYSGACRWCACPSYRAADPRYCICVCGHNLVSVRPAAS